MSSYKIDQIIDLLEKFYCKNEFEKIKPLGLVSEYFREFNPSAGHQIINSVLKDNNPVPSKKFLVIERCFRKIDLGQIGWSHHLSFWEMADAAYVGQVSKEQRELTFQLYKELLEKELGINTKKLLISVSGGGNIENLEIEPDTESIELWKKLGFKEDQIVSINGRRNFIYAREHESPAGQSCEIFFDRGQEYPNTIRYLEIASLNMYKYRVIKEPEKENIIEIVQSKNCSYACAIGLERLVSVLENKKTIYEVSNIEPLVKIINSYLRNKSEKEIYSKDVNKLTDILRAIQFIIADGQQPDKTTRGKILRDILRETRGLVYFMDLKNLRLYEEFIDKIIEIYGKRHLQLNSKRKETIEMIREYVLDYIS